MQYLESDGSNFEIYSVTDRKPVEISKNRRNMAKARFLGNDPSKCVLDKLQAKFEKDVPARGELQQRWAVEYLAMVLFIF